MSNRQDSAEGYARSINSAVLYVNSQEQWMVGGAGQTVAQYQAVSFGGLSHLSDAVGVEALAALKNGDGYSLIARSTTDASVFYGAELDASGRITSVKGLTNAELFAAEVALGEDLNDNGGIGDGMVLLDDGLGADLYVDGLGGLQIRNAQGAFVPLQFGGGQLTLAALGDNLEITKIVASGSGFQAFVTDAAGNVYSAGLNSSGTTTAVTQLGAGDIRTAQQSGLDVAERSDLAADAGWTAVLKVAALKAQVEQLTQGGQKIGHAGLVQLVDTAIAQAGGAGNAVGQNVVDDLRAVAARGKALFASTAADGSTSADYLSHVFSKMVNSSKANNFYTGGEAKASALGNLSDASTAGQLQKLANKWLLGLDNPNPTTEGDTANPAAAAASGVYKTFAGSLVVDGISFSDVFQGSAGDCYLLAAAAALAQSRPGVVQSMFTDNGVGASGVQTFGVRLYDANGQANWVTVSNQFVVKSAGDTGAAYAKLTNAAKPAGAELWMPLLEKAYAQMNETGVLQRGANDGKNAMFAIEGGLAEAGIFITGRGAYSFDSTVTESTTMNGIASQLVKPVPAGSTALDEVVRYINAGKTVFIGSQNKTQDASGKTLFTGGHAYMAFDADTTSATNTTVKVFNPWGDTTGATDANHVAPFTVDLAQLVGVNGYSVWMFDLA
ncbi:C2 family cysteine protease [uncultured Xylophilus sp.]|uniref:C2 family cysteine protease n=1 Tax=uncultured Xylophilus sp. TaxID=296832 RepID=UPI0025EFCD11|nr:C2 family cysteine protease [uncultured Xylophilus sp.]